MLVFNRKNMRYALIYLAGMITTALGINIILRSSLGAGAWDTVTNNLSILAHISLGTASASVNIIILAFIMVYNKKIKFLFVLVPIIGIALAIDFWDIIVFDTFYPSHVLLKLLYFVGGTGILTLGLASMISTKYPAMVFDELTLSLMRLLKIPSFFKTRILIELFAIVLASIFGFLANVGFGAVNFGSLMLAIIIGPLIALHLKWLSKIMTTKKV
ncbi:MAG: hypothetical protein ABII85_00020 [Bacillota bacterium]